MELQWPLIIFTTLVTWSAGLFSSQCILALKGEAAKAQMPAWIASAVLLVVGGIAVFFHLEHWERIFNGFGHLSSGITQELIAIVVLAVVAVVYLVFLRKGENAVPSWVAILGIVVSAILVVVMAHSYMMPARPAWNSLAWVLYVLGNACVLGTATMAAIVAAVDKEPEASNLLSVLVLAGAAVNAVGVAVYTAAMSLSASAFANLGYYFDLSNPTSALADASSLSPFAGENALLVVGGAIAVGALVPLILAFLGKKQGKWMAFGAGAAVCALVGAVCMRVVFYQMGASVFMFY